MQEAQPTSPRWGTSVERNGSGTPRIGSLDRTGKNP